MQENCKKEPKDSKVVAWGRGLGCKDGWEFPAHISYYKSCCLLRFKKIYIGCYLGKMFKFLNYETKARNVGNPAGEKTSEGELQRENDREAATLQSSLRCPCAVRA